MDDDWTPPSEEEELRLKKQRERNNKISKLMGNYLLKGYKMLGSTCNKCHAILLRDRQGEDFCVGCVEVDDASSIPPDVTQIHGSKLLSSGGTTATQQTPANVYLPTTTNGNLTNNEARLVTTKERALGDQTLDCVFQQISWANNCLTLTDINLEQRSNLVSFIKNCYDTINTIMKCR